MWASESMYSKFTLPSKPITIVDTIRDEELLGILVNAVYRYPTTDRDKLRAFSAGDIYDRSVYERRFGSWSNSIRLAGFTDYNRVLLVYFVDYTGEDPIEFLKLKIGHNGDFTDEQKFYIANPHIKRNTRIMRKHFKSINFYYILTGKRIWQVGKIIIKQIADDGHICDSNSEKIVDNYLNDNGIPHAIHVTYPRSSKKCDFRVGNVYIEYAGLYNFNQSYNQISSIRSSMPKKTVWLCIFCMICQKNRYLIWKISC